MKKFTLVALLATFSLGAFAQGGEKGPFLTSRFRDNWFISAGGGVNIYYGEADRNVKFGKRMAPALDVAVGKWITPAIGVRLEYSGLKAKGGALYLDAPYINGSIVANTGKKDDYYPEKFKVSFYHMDFLWNASTSFGRYKAHRRWEFIPFVGFGSATSSSALKAKAPRSSKTRIHEFGVTAGLINKIRLTNALDFNLELRGMVVKQTFDGTIGGKRGEGMGTVTAGLSYKLGKHGFSKPVAVAPADYSLYNDRIKVLEGDLASSRARADQLAKDLAAARNVKPQTTTEYVFPDLAIFFEIGKAVLSKKEQVNVAYIAEAIKKMPAGQKVILDGNADSKTGTKTGNQTLSEKRVKAVYDALIANGVKASQIETVAHGDTKEPFGHNQPALNRVLIIEH